MRPRVLAHVTATLQAFVWALLIAIGAGLLIGLVLGMSRLAGEVAEPILNALYAIPKITLYPVILLMFGLGLPAKIAFGTIHGIFPGDHFDDDRRPLDKSGYPQDRAGDAIVADETMRTVLFPAACRKFFGNARRVCADIAGDVDR